MDMDRFMIGALIMLGAILVARVLGMNEIKKLSEEQQAQLVKLFGNQGLWNLGLVIGMVAIFFVCLRFELVSPIIAMAVYIIGVVGLMGYSMTTSYRKLSDNNFPTSFNQRYILSAVIRLVGIIVFFGMVVSE